jgi:hypothetical protein
MWLNIVLIALASLVTGIIIGWVFACPRRWDQHPWGELTEPLTDRKPARLSL